MSKKVTIKPVGPHLVAETARFVRMVYSPDPAPDTEALQVVHYPPDTESERSIFATRSCKATPVSRTEADWARDALGGALWEVYSVLKGMQDAARVLKMEREISDLSDNAFALWRESRIRPKLR